MLAALVGSWWAWVVLGFALGVLEVLAPGYIFLGFAIGAVLTGIVLVGRPGTRRTGAGTVFILSSPRCHLLAWSCCGGRWGSGRVR